MVIKPADRDTGRSACGRHDRMIWQMSGVAHRAHHNDPFARTLFDDLRERISQIALLVIAARGNINDANSIFLTVRKHPFEPDLDVSTGLRWSAWTCLYLGILVTLLIVGVDRRLRDWPL